MKRKVTFDADFNESWARSSGTDANGERKKLGEDNDALAGEFTAHMNQSSHIVVSNVVVEGGDLGSEQVLSATDVGEVKDILR